jgi:ABC-type sugar transport system ATPase subunit
MATVTLRHLGKDHGATPVLGDVSLEVADGELLVLVGPSGCGKSTLLRCIAGLEQLTRGTIEIDGRDVTRVEPRDRDIAMVFQSYALYPHLTVRENLAFGLKMRKTPRAEIATRVGDAAAMLGLEPLLERRPGQLSGGQRQRVAMGRAVVRRPKVFLFDEPLSNLDAALRGQMRVELMRLHQRLGGVGAPDGPSPSAQGKATMVYVTHDQVEAMTLADRIAVLNKGALLQVGPPSELYARPATLFVAKFIGTPEMNILDVGAARRAGLVGELPSSARHVGVRAEGLTLGRAQAVVGDGVAATVEVVEHLGWEALVHLLAGELRLLVRVESGAAPRIGERVRVTADPAQLHLFDDAGARLEHAQPRRERA